MVNYKCVVAALAALVAVVSAAPAPDCDKHYDQRQNGTENYRLNIDGVVIAVAPAETLIAAVSEVSDLFDISDLDEFLKPPSPSSSSSDSTAKPEINIDSKPETAPLSDVTLNPESKPQRKDASAGKQEKFQRLKNRLAHVLIPLLRKTRHH